MTNLRSDKKIYCQELKLLRQELNNLKECQLKYFTFSLTATGIILGLIAKFDQLPGILFLLPLTILIPSWTVFFDKAKTITRIVAYYRILETIIFNDISFVHTLMEEGKKFRFVGWENSLMYFRDWQKNEAVWEGHEECTIKLKFHEKIVSFFKIAMGSYWRLIYFSFLGVSGVCALIGTKSLLAFLNIDLRYIFNINYFSNNLISILVVLFIWLIFLGAAIYNLSVVISLVSGEHTYDRNLCVWCKIFGINYDKFFSNAPAGRIPTN